MFKHIEWKQKALPMQIPRDRAIGISACTNCKVMTISTDSSAVALSSSTEVFWQQIRKGGGGLQ